MLSRTQLLLGSRGHLKRAIIIPSRLASTDTWDTVFVALGTATTSFFASFGAANYIADMRAGHLKTLTETMVQAIKDNTKAEVEANTKRLEDLTTTQVAAIKAHTETEVTAIKDALTKEHDQRMLHIKELMDAKLEARLAAEP